MTIPSTGAVSISTINTEIGRSSSYAGSNLNESLLRQTAASISGSSVTSGTISLNNFRGASASQVFNNITSSVGSTNVFGGVYYYSYGLKTINTPDYPNVVMGSIPSNSLLIDSGGTAKIANLYSAQALSGDAFFLDMTGTPAYTGSYGLWYSTSSTDAWPSTAIGTLSYVGTVSYSGGTAYRWTLAATVVSALQNMKSFRITKV